MKTEPLKVSHLNVRIFQGMKLSLRPMMQKMSWRKMPNLTLIKQIISGK